MKYRATKDIKECYLKFIFGAFKKGLHSELPRKGYKTSERVKLQNNFRISERKGLFLEELKKEKEMKALKPELSEKLHDTHLFSVYCC